MTEEVTQEATGNENPNDKGLPPGVTSADTGEGNRGDGAPAAPVVSNVPPKDAITGEEEPETKDEPKEETPEEQNEEPVDNKDAEPSEEQEETDTLEDYPDYGDSNANAVVEILRDAKIPVDEAHALFKDAIETGDFTKIDMSMLTEKLGKGKADLVMLGVQTYYNNFTASVKETVNAVHETVGGEANYAKVQKWARNKASSDPAFKAQMDGFNQMFDLNKTAAIMAAKELTSLYEADSGNSSLTRKQVHGDTAATTANSTSDYLSRSDYLAQVKEAHLKNDTHEINRLRSLRKASKQIN